MALFTHSGTAAVDLEVANTYRVDISEVLYASLVLENNTLGATQVGEEFADLQLYWTEDTLNQYKVTSTNNISAITTTAWTFSASDASVLDVGYLLQLDTGVGQTAANGGEIVQIVAISGTNVTVTRGYNNSGTGVVTGTNLVWRIIHRPTFPNSDLGKDMTRARISKTNYINRFAFDVNLDSEQIVRSQAGYVPGVQDEMDYQFEQRLAELKRIMQQAFLYSVPPAAGNPSNDYETGYGLIPWLNTQANATSAPITGAQTFSDSTVNTMTTNIFLQGGISDVLIVPPVFVQRIGQLYTDRIRLNQDDRVRGFFAQEFVPAMANPLTIVNEPYLNAAFAIVSDLSRVRIRPFRSEFSYVISAPSFRDGDAIRFLSKWSLEVRNTGTDVGYSHQLATALS